MYRIYVDIVGKAQKDNGRVECRPSQGGIMSMSL